MADLRSLASARNAAAYRQTLNAYLSAWAVVHAKELRSSPFHPYRWMLAESQPPVCYVLPLYRMRALPAPFKAAP